MYCVTGIANCVLLLDGIMQFRHSLLLEVVLGKEAACRQLFFNVFMDVLL